MEWEAQQSVFFAIVFDQVTIVIPFELKLFKDFVISWFLWESFVHLSRTHTRRESKNQSSEYHSQYFYLKIKNSNEAKTVAKAIYETVVTQTGMGDV